MENFGVKAVGDLAVRKADFFNRSVARYLIYSMLAGVFCALGMLLAHSAGGLLDAFEATKGLAKIIYSISFAFSFTFIVFAGAELFTGNVLVMFMGFLDKVVSLKATLKSLFAVYLGNWLGAGIMSVLIGFSGLLENQVLGRYLVANAAVKMNLPAVQALVRGILCNMLICLAVWAVSKMKSEGAKMLILAWSIYGFCISGFEHSIANMALFVMAALSSWRTADITVMGYFNNIIYVTLGNIIGGLLVGIVYFCIGNLPEK